eukprot:1146321-Pelagomonas_calceolata.AAC.1
MLRAEVERERLLQSLEQQEDPFGAQGKDMAPGDQQQQKGQQQLPGPLSFTGWGTMNMRMDNIPVLAIKCLNMQETYTQIMGLHVQPRGGCATVSKGAGSTFCTTGENLCLKNKKTRFAVNGCLYMQIPGAPPPGSKAMQQPVKKVKKVTEEQRVDKKLPPPPPPYFDPALPNGAYFLDLGLEEHRMVSLAGVMSSRRLVDMGGIKLLPFSSIAAVIMASWKPDKHEGTSGCEDSCVQYAEGLHASMMVAAALVDLYKGTGGLAWTSAWLDDQRLPSPPKGKLMASLMLGFRSARVCEGKNRYCSSKKFAQGRRPLQDHRHIHMAKSIVALLTGASAQGVPVSPCFWRAVPCSRENHAALVVLLTGASAQSRSAPVSDGQAGHHAAGGPAGLAGPQWPSGTMPSEGLLKVSSGKRKQRPI